MHVIVLGAGIIGVSTAWYLLEHGHTVTVVDRQGHAALETSFGNGAQISVCFCEPWANAGAPLKVAKWLLQDDAPLLFRPRLDPAQWRWGLSFLTQCSDAAFARNVKQLVSLGRFSHQAHKKLVEQTGIEYNRIDRGILHFFSSQKDFEGGAKAAELMRDYGVERHILSREEVLKVEPALAQFGQKMFGGTYTPSDESGDCLVFTQKLAELCKARGAEFLFEHDIQDLVVEGGKVLGAKIRSLHGGDSRVIKGDAAVVALGSYSRPLLAKHGVSLNIYPAKGYSATLNLKRPELASTVSLLDDTRKLAISRLGNQVRIAGTAELSGFDTSLDGSVAKARCAALLRRYEELFPGAADLSEPNFWTGLRPSTPTNIPYIGSSRIKGLWLNTGHGTLGWTHGAGSGLAMAQLISGQRPELEFGFCSRA
ncbi:MAG: D-amino acid dehydrogenase [Burkholderiaceae bacterium]|nr:MAG: D-amino acid dehydrogenase [Burkholderiaceae bacterium]